MDLYLLAELKTIRLKVTTVDMQKPPPDFRYLQIIGVSCNIHHYLLEACLISHSCNGL